MVIRRARKWLADRDIGGKKGKRKREKLYALSVCVCSVGVCVPTCMYMWALGRFYSLSPSLCLTSDLEMLASLSLWHFQKAGWGPGWCSSVDWAWACEWKGCQFGSQSGHRPGLWARSLVGDMWGATTHWCFSPYFSPSLPLPLNK